MVSIIVERLDHAASREPREWSIVAGCYAESRGRFNRECPHETTVQLSSSPIKNREGYVTRFATSGQLLS